jgi:hypothetical protein
VLFFELPDGVPMEKVLLNIARGFQVLINSEESLNLHRLMVPWAARTRSCRRSSSRPGLSGWCRSMERLLRKINQSGALRIDKPITAAEHFFCMLKGAPNFRLLFAGGEPWPEGEAHVQEVVAIFMRAYQPSLKQLLCRSRACPRFTAFCLTDRGACIASKPAPTEGEGVVFKASTLSSDKYRTGSICHPAHGSAWARQCTAPCAGA